ncbi:MAG: SDR family NAD(P)-dependent oxidoreductase [Acidobacteria bacterium]|nr:SDR family NAD(P)-dependent oxidoreductase [Acidobacteriota bacterium]
MKRVVLITGASSGIGYRLALEVAKNKGALALVARRRELLDDLSYEVEKLGGEALTLVCDVGDQEQVRQAVSETVRYFGRIDLAILSAGVNSPSNAVSFKAGRFEHLLRVNVLGVAYCLEALIPLMRGQKNGIIAAISSLAGDRGMPGYAGYCATKAALSTLIEGMRVELGQYGVRLVTIEPGYVLTPMTENAGKMPFLMQADEAARLILRRIERGDRVIRFPLVPSLFMKMVRMMPVSLFDVVAARRRPIKSGSGSDLADL